jgi:hypothetical protein
VFHVGLPKSESFHLPEKAVDDGIRDLGRAIDETIEKVRKTGSGIR